MQQEQNLPPDLPTGSQTVSTITEKIEPLKQKKKFDKRTMFKFFGLVVAAVGFLGIGMYSGMRRSNIAYLEEINDLSAELTKEEIKYSLAGALVIKDGVVEKKDGFINWVALAKGATIKQGDVIRTGENSRAVIELDDGSAVRLDENTEVSFSSLSDEVIFITQYEGQAYHRVHPGSLVYNVKSLGVIMTALGTAFNVATDSELEETEVSVYESSVEVMIKDGEDVVKEEVEEGEKATVNKDDKDEIEVEKLADAEGDDFYAWNQELNGEEVPEEEVKLAMAEEEDQEKEEKVEVKTEEVKEEVKEEEKQEEKKEEPKVYGSLSLHAEAGDGKATLNWDLDGEAPYGYKLCMSESQANPTYPVKSGDKMQYFSSSGTKSYTWTGLDGGKTYHFRVGAYNGSGGVVYYSGNVTATPWGGGTEEKDEEEKTTDDGKDWVDSLSLEVVDQGEGKVKAEWSISGGNVYSGFKICYGEDANPTYPADNCTYKSTGSSSHEWTLQIGKTYHFRVGAYRGNGVAEPYSNDVELTVE
jgi:FecR-like protein